MTKKLFIIGNGFDLYHGIDTSYYSFANYLKENDYRTYEIVEQYIIPEIDLWSDLEILLADIDTDSIIDNAEQYLISYADEEWSDSYHHDYEFEIEKICDAVSKDLLDNFSHWVRQIEIENFRRVHLKCIDKNALFLNFNYTNTLQKIYSVSNDRILHIHGSAMNDSSPLILGHGWQRKEYELLSRSNDENTDVRVAGGNELIDDLLSRTFKPTKKIICKNKAFFNRLHTVTEVFVLGHSLSEIDKPYFVEILKKVRPDATWTISYYVKKGEVESNVKDATKHAAEEIGIPTSRLKLSLLENL